MRSVLLIEDYKTMREFLRVVLEHRGFHVLEAGDALTGLRVAEREQPEAILMDIQLPGLDGFQATALLKANPATRDIPVIATTATRLLPHDRSAKVFGFVAFMRKPLRIEPLVRLIDAHARRTTLNQPTWR